ncbi:dolichol kinase, partial [Halorubrum tibetense]
VADGLPPVMRGVAVDDNLTIPPAALVGMVAVVTLVG